MGNDFFIVNSSFEYFPALPIHHSRDLVHWRLLGHVLDRPSQVKLDGARASGGYFAPTLRHIQGRFHVVCTNVTGGGNFIVSADDAQGPWSDPVMLELPGIDPSLFEDVDGRVYLCGTSSGAVVLAEIDLATARIGPIRAITAGTGGRYPEGPHLYRRGDDYLLVLSEGGTEHGHMVTVARARSPRGPWWWSERNPLLSHRSLLDPLQNVGHLDLFDDAEGRSWAVCLGVRPHGYPEVHHLGRETLLLSVAWRDGWPQFGEGGRVPRIVSVPFPPSPWVDRPARETFGEETLPPAWVHRRVPSFGTCRTGGAEGGLVLVANGAGLDEVGAPAWVGRRQCHFRATFRSAVDFLTEHEGQEAGITVCQNESHHYDLLVVFAEGRPVGEFRRRIGSLTAVTRFAVDAGGPVQLEVSSRVEDYTFRVFRRGTWEAVGRAESRYVATEVAGGFTGVFLGLYCGGPAGAAARFPWAEYLPEAAT